MKRNNLLAGMVFGRLHVIEKDPDKKYNWLCECACGNSPRKSVYYIHLLDGTTKSCGCWQRDAGRARIEEILQRRYENGAVRGRTTLNGYVYTYGEIYPGSELRKSGRRYEHIVMMSRRLGRPLLLHEHVHHKNGVRSDNRDENLELWSTSHPPGQRVEDKLAWAKEIIEQYEPEWRK